MEEKQRKKLECFIRVINRDIDEQIRETRSAAADEGERLIREAEETAQTESLRRIQAETARINADCRRQLAQAEQDSRRALLAHREGLVEELFSSVRARLSAYTESEEYPAYLGTLLKDEPLGTGAVVLLSQKDMAHRASLLPLVGGCDIRADETISLGGLSVFYPAQQKIIDKTLDTAFDEQRRAFCNTAALRL